MNLNELFAPQAELDKYIVEEHNLQGKDLLKKKTVALICELYECVNEARFFKFWSHDQKARTFEPNPDDICEECKGQPIFFEENKPENRIIGQCEHCDGCGVHFHNPLLEEYVDTIHFALSIANDLGYHEHEYSDPGFLDLSNSVLGLTQLATVLPYSKKKNIGMIFNYLIKLGYQLGFDEKTVIDAYFEKNKENHKRQESGVY